jgi:hypothetical protein
VIDSNCRLLIFVSTFHGYMLLDNSTMCWMEDVWDIALSPLGSTMIVFNKTDNVTLLKFSRNQITRLATEITFTAKNYSRCIFRGEDSFVIPDKNWDFWVYTYDPDTQTFSKLFYYIPEIRCPTRISARYGRTVDEIPGYASRTSLEYVYVPSTESTTRTCLFFHDVCSGSHYKNGKHLIHLVLNPRATTEECYTTILQNCSIVGSILDSCKRRIYIVCLTNMGEFEFLRENIPHLCRSNFVCTNHKRNWMGYNNLAIYSIDVDKAKEGAPLDPRFYMPSSLKNLENNQNIKDADDQPFQHIFYPWDIDDLSIDINRIFLLLQHDSTILCFPLDCDIKTPPFAVNVGREFQLFTSTAYMKQLCCLPDVGGSGLSLRLLRFCPKGTKYLYIEQDDELTSDDKCSIKLKSLYTKFF